MLPREFQRFGNEWQIRNCNACDYSGWMGARPTSVICQPSLVSANDRFDDTAYIVISLVVVCSLGTEQKDCASLGATGQAAELFINRWGSINQSRATGPPVSVFV